MKSEATRIWRLGLPDDWEPDGYWCVSFQIPAGDQYVEALSAALGLLTLSKTFERDETHEGARTVAQTWKRALMIAPIAVEENCVVVEPIPVPDAAAAADISAAIFTQFFQYVAREINTCATSPDLCGACVDALYGDLTPYGASEAVRGALSQLCNQLNSNPSTRAEYEFDCRYYDEFQDLSSKINDNPYDWLNQLSSWLFDWLDNTSDQILNSLNTVMALMGAGAIGFIQDNGGIPSGGGASFGGDCSWSYDADFLTTADSWQAMYAGIAWGSGQGWYNNTSAVISITRPMTAWVTKIEFDINQPFGNDNLKQALMAIFGVDGGPGGVYNVLGEEGATHFSWEGTPRQMTGPVLYVQTHQPYNDGTPCNVKIVSVHMEGIGDPPPEI